MKLEKSGVESTLMIIGEGNYFSKLEAEFKDSKNIQILSKLPQSQLSSILSRSDIGLSPMPEYGAWKVASPLKLSEYLASGMAVCGIDHAGHRLKDSGDWFQLFEQSKFIDKTVEWISDLNREKLTHYQELARRYAEKHLSWSHSVEALESLIISASDSYTK
jgi:glycosyltransferase involved in cell wall biosynthesis